MEIHIWFGGTGKGVDCIKNSGNVRPLLRKYEICSQGKIGNLSVGEV